MRSYRIVGVARSPAALASCRDLSVLQSPGPHPALLEPGLHLSEILRSFLCTH